MKTLTLDSPGEFRYSETSRPDDLPPGHALLQVRRIGVCGTDLHAFRGRQPFFKYPRILGHELGVEVVAVDDPSGRIRVGQRCAVEPYLHCGECQACRRGKTNCCQQLRVLGVTTDGGMREQIVLPVEKLLPSETLSLEQLALVETLGIGAHAVARGNPTADDLVLIVGSGPIGLGIVPFAKAAGCPVAMMDVNQSRLAFARERMGVEKTILPGDDAVAAIRAAFDGDLPTVVFDATGNPASMHQAFKYPAPSGRLVFVGLFIGDVTFHDPDFHWREQTLLATRNALPADLQRVMTFMEDGTIDTRPWITHTSPLETVITDFPGWLEPSAGVVKALITLDE
jgi:2-desacetyl-2-hydroxyethyl bacteriochlorophyllide A dehydrogenase